MKKNIKIMSFIGIIIVFIIIILIVYFNTAFISKNEVKNIIIKAMNKNEERIHFEEIDLDLIKKYYEVELYYNNQEYEYKINAKNGNIIYTNYNAQTANNEENNFTTSNQQLTLEDAKRLVLEKENINEKDIIYTKTEKDKEDNLEIYEIEFIYNNYKYEYEVSIKYKEIIKSSKEKIR